MHPELIVSRLFTEKLRDDESVIVTGNNCFLTIDLQMCNKRIVRMKEGLQTVAISGVQQFGTYSGFSHTFKWEGPYEDHTRRYEDARIDTSDLWV